MQFGGKPTRTSWTYNRSELVVCPHCTKSFHSSQLELHIASAHGYASDWSKAPDFGASADARKSQPACPAKCPICDGQFARNFTLKRHMKHIHGASQCPKCLEILKAGADFNRHLIYCNK
ncbi:Zinc finger protein 317 [Plakobranchus ocellatus]|uniref:Zinc finger protein 317 n=1 Tax=Plakobranchus ocellatus TaxID=259542 RepID=A0AAV3ZC29_9GAST|nr:Zinc finger protein 317 [Plakobranchus ocellatus]